MTKDSLLKLLMMLLVCCGLCVSTAYAQDEPSLPAGLEEDDTPVAEEPALPAGLEPDESEGLPGEPMLPEGLTEMPEDVEKPSPYEAPRELPFDLSGFWEMRGGMRTQRDRYERDASLGESHLQLELEKDWTRSALRVITDLVYDPVLDEHDIRLDHGQGWLDLREASFSLTPIDFVDVKVGRQILTWGTGDLLFINDLFPKDWNSFFIGRDPEYLKSPSDAVRVSLFSHLVNLDVAYMPRFNSDRFIDGRRISYWNGMLGRLVGRNALVLADKPNDWFDDDEVAWRLFRNVRGYELAAYGYQGFWKSPGGLDPISGRATFPKLWVYGVSVRGNVGKGIGNIELGYYDSENDRAGDDPFVRNSEIRLLVGYEQELAKDLTVGVQYYLEYMTDYDNYRRTLPPGSAAADEDRHVMTLRATKLLMSQNLRMSLFTYYSPSDRDAYLRPNIHYKINDQWAAESGGNVFFGKDDHTFFGQFADNTNVYVGVRYGF